MSQQKTWLAPLSNPVRAHALPKRATGIRGPDEIGEPTDVEPVVSEEIGLNRRTVDMADAIRTTVAVFTVDANLNRSIEVRTEPAWVDVDATRLAQVLTNIVANAVRYTQPGAHICVSLHADGNDAVVTIEDTGAGISPGLLPFIFDQHERADRTLDHTQAGFCIGLTRVRRLVQLHGGTVVAASAGEGLGSTFTVRLAQVSPLRDARMSAPLVQEEFA